MKPEKCAVLVALMLSVPVSATDPFVSFTRDIRPIFASSCWQCHGLDFQLSSLDLRTREGALKGGEHGPALVPGKPEESRLFRRISGLEKPTMPFTGNKLTEEQIATIKAWISQGAVWEDTPSSEPAPTVKAKGMALEEMEIPAEARNYWAFRKPVRPPVPVLSNRRMKRHPVDAFLRKAMAEKGLKLAPPADRVTLLRRAYLDLIGLPPSPTEAAEFLNDHSTHAWERLIDRLLASPHYGERWGRHWLDVARYADSSGFEHDYDRPNAWRYRDYVIQAFNKDTPYNFFIQEQIAGDELDWASHDTLIATGFLRNHAKVGFREKDNPQFRYDYLDDMIATIGRGILGLTLQCARCHNHKFDPIPQKDYYRMQASLFGYVEVDHPLTTPEQAVAYEKKLAAVEARIKERREQIRKLEAPYREALLPEKYKQFPQNVQIVITTPESQRTPGQILLVNQILSAVSVSSSEIDRIMKPDDLAAKQKLLAEIRAIESERPKPIPVAMGITDGDYRFAADGPGDEPAPGKGPRREAIAGSFLHQGPGKYQPPPSYFLHRGDIDARGSLMQPGFITVATYGNPPTERPPAHGRTSGRRRALAEWLTSLENPLTARVIVNRIWHHHFGRGLVASLDNFGKMGDKPTHPELLDWLAVEFMKGGWSIKHMHRLLMTSQAYKMSSQFADSKNLTRDPDNRFAWRFRMQRLDAEALRDAILTVSGGLNRQIGGPSIFPKLSDEILHSMKYGIWKRQEDTPDVWRRSVYVYRRRGVPFPMFQVFDLPDQNTSGGARNRSTVPTQALVLLNDEFVLKQTKLFADRVEAAVPNDKAKQVDLAYRIALSRSPTAEERRLALAFLKTQKLADFTQVLVNLNEFLYLR